MILEGSQKAPETSSSNVFIDFIYTLRCVDDHQHDVKAQDYGNDTKNYISYILRFINNKLTVEVLRFFVKIFSEDEGQGKSNASE